MCDLPYGQLSRPKIGGQKSERLPSEHCAWDIKIDLKAFWEQVERLSRNDKVPVIHFCNTKFGIDLINSKPNWFRYDLVWNKDRGVSFLLANKQPMKSHEMIYVFCKAGSYYKRIDEVGDFKSWGAHQNQSKTRTTIEASGMNIAVANDGTHRCVKSVITLRKPNTLGHPTEKPLDLYKWLLERYCPPGGTVLDPTAGSFNSCFSAFDLGLNAIGIEKDDKFYKKACDRADALNVTG